MIALLALSLLLAAPSGAPSPPPSASFVTVDVPVSLYVPASDLVRRLTVLFPARSSAKAIRVTAPPGGRRLRLTGPAELVERVRRLVTRPPCTPDRPGLPVAVIPLRYQAAVVLRRRLSGALPAGAQIRVDHPTNSLIVVAEPDLAREVRAQVQRLDVPPPRRRSLPRR